MRLVTFGDDPGLVKYLKTEYTNVGLGRKYVDLFSKFEALKEWLDTTNIDQNELIIFVDGYDVVQRRTDMENFEKEFEKFDADMVISAETFCWPNYYIRFYFPDSPTKYRWPNSGTFAGRAWAVRKMLNWGPYRVNYDDQGYMHDFFLRARNDTRIKLDYHQVLFQTATCVPWKELDETRAFFIHFNGKAFLKMDGTSVLDECASGRPIGNLPKKPQIMPC